MIGLHLVKMSLLICHIHRMWLLPGKISEISPISAFSFLVTKVFGWLTFDFKSVLSCSSAHMYSWQSSFFKKQKASENDELKQVDPTMCKRGKWCWLVLYVQSNPKTMWKATSHLNCTWMSKKEGFNSSIGCKLHLMEPVFFLKSSDQIDHGCVPFKLFPSRAGFLIIYILHWSMRAFRQKQKSNGARTDVSLW